MAIYRKYLRPDELIICDEFKCELAVEDSYKELGCCDSELECCDEVCECC